MRFRPFGITGTAVSALSLALTDGPGRAKPSDWTALIYEAFENGINTFEIVGRDPAILDGLAVALQAVERRLVFLGLRLGASPTRMGRDFSADGLLKSIDATLARTGCGYLDVAMLDDPGMAELSPEALQALKEVRSQGRAKLIGVAGQDEAMDAYILTEAFDVIATPYNLLSGWRERNRLKTSQERDMAVIGYDFYPAAVRQHTVDKAAADKGGWMRLGPKESPLKGAGTYNFLSETPGWTAEQICLAYALTEPALATVQITAEAFGRMAELAAVTEKDLPAGAGSRVEMARFGGQDLPNPGASKA